MYHKHPHWYPGQRMLQMLKDMSLTMTPMEIAREIKCHPHTVQITLKRDGISVILARRMRAWVDHKRQKENEFPQQGSQAAQEERLRSFIDWEACLGYTPQYGTQEFKEALEYIVQYH